MKTFLATEYKMQSETEIGATLNALLECWQDDKEEKRLVFEKGVYYLDIKNCPVLQCHITNTIGEKEFFTGEEKWKTPTAICCRKLHHLTIDGNGSTFVVRGVATNMVIEDCENVSVENMEILVEDPNIHCVRVTKRKLFSTEFTIADGEQYEVKDGELYFYGNGYRFPLSYRAGASFCNVDFPDDYKKYSRWRYPFRANRYTVDGNKITLSGRTKLQVGQNVYLFDYRRKQVGIFIQRSKNIALVGITHRFSYSLAVVAQDCENLLIEKCNFSPVQGSRIQVASVADFLHLCCCRGKLTVRGCYFSSAGDDVLNVHGIHFPVKDINGKEVTIRFAHSEAYGFNIFHKGDRIALIGKTDLIERTQATVIQSEMLDLYTVKLTLDTEIDKRLNSCLVENVSANPELIFEDNTMERISTRGVLCTTRGKSVIRNNTFRYTKMWSIEVADDGMDWYEGNMVKDLTVEGNDFQNCEQTFIHVFPHNISKKGFVHDHIAVRNNKFHLTKKQTCYIFRCTRCVSLSGNQYFGRKPKLVKIGVGKVEKDF